jgi:3'(2'), 5'-bisphosphate nucleotidase
MDTDNKRLKAYFQNLLGVALRASLSAGDAVMRIYNTNFEVTLKNNHSPLTEADRQSHDILAAHLSKEIPLLSEEGSKKGWEDRKNWNLFWLIDPLDGTKEFIKRNGEFTVNVALMEDNSPIAGIVHLPAMGVLYFGGRGLGAYRINGATIEKIKASKSNGTLELALEYGFLMPDLYADRAPDTVKVIRSASHSTKEETEFISRLKAEIDSLVTASAGSSLKFCRVAEGSADLYARLGPTMEWDTASGQCIAESAGCEVLDLAELAPIRYNKPVLRNSAFMAMGSQFRTKAPWRKAALSCARACMGMPPHARTKQNRSGHAEF